jgi:hypothetical protein
LRTESEQTKQSDQRCGRAARRLVATQPRITAK